MLTSVSQSCLRCCCQYRNDTYLDVCNLQEYHAVCQLAVILFALSWLVVALNAARNYSNLHAMPMASWDETFDLRSRQFRHVVIVPCYLDPLEILHECVDTLTFQTNPASLVVAITFESKTPDLARKIESVRKEYCDKFGDFLILVHELKANEIPGGCSNKNFALREAYKFCSHQHGSKFKIQRYTITTCDTDSKFHPRYFECLEAAYNKENPFEAAPVKMCVWQPPVFYNWNLDERPFFNRVTCIIRSTMMLGGLISFNLNPMSIFSYPMELGYISGFINPRYGVDDIIAKVRWMVHTNSQAPVKMLACPVISGPTVGNSFWEELNMGPSDSPLDCWELRIVPLLYHSLERQAVFQWHYVVLLFFVYYGVLLCSAGIYGVLASIPLPWVHYEGKEVQLPNNGPTVGLQYVGLMGMAVQMVAFAIAFLIDGFAARRIGVVEDINPIRNFLHWLSTPFVLLLYSMIAFVSIVRFVFEGKAMARHDMAGKNGLLPSSAVNEQSIPFVVQQQQHEAPGYESIGTVAEQYRNKEVVAKPSFRSVSSSRSDLGTGRGGGEHHV